MTQTRKALISPGFGAGWSTWIGTDREHQTFALFDEKLVAAVERREPLGDPEDPRTPLGDFVKRYREQFNTTYVCVLGADQLEVEEIAGDFRVDEYDGSESVTYRSDQSEWI